MNYLIADFIIRIKNAAQANRKQVVLPYSKLNKEVGKVLVKNGFLEDIKDVEIEGRKALSATVRYYKRIPICDFIEYALETIHIAFCSCASHFYDPQLQQRSQLPLWNWIGVKKL